MITAASSRTSVRDPVCGMELAPEHAAAMRMRDGLVLHFCSNDCVAAFDRDPNLYVAPASLATEVTARAAAPTRIALPMADLQRAGAPALERALGLVPGVVRVNANVKGKQLVVEYDPSRASVATLLGAVRAAGFRPADQTLRLKVSGLYCAECVARIEDGVKAVPGVFDATMSAANNEVRVVILPGHRRSGVAHLRH